MGATVVGPPEASLKSIVTFFSKKLTFFKKKKKKVQTFKINFKEASSGPRTDHG